MKTDLDYMKRAYHLAIKAKGKTSPNPMVGSVIVKGNRIIAEGWHRRCGGAHAEIEALNKIKGDAKGARMYVTLEPCYHYGLTSPCVDQVIDSGIKEIVIGMKDPNPLTNGKSIQKLKRVGIKTKVGFLQKELSELNEAFIKFTKKKMPFVAAKCAQSLDGKIAITNGKSKWITSKQTRNFARRIRNEYDAILVGIDTVLKDNPKLTPSSKVKRLKKIILDSSLKIPLNARLFSGTKSTDCIIVTTKHASKVKKQALRNKGIQVIECPKRNQNLDLKWLFKELAKKKIISILMEGGAHVIGSGLKDQLIDKMSIYIAPKIFGDNNALSSIIGIRTADVNNSIALEDLSVERIGNDVLVQGYINKRK